MPFPKKIKKHLPLTQSKTLLPRREEIANMISNDGTYLPKSLLHADLDGGFLDFVKEKLVTVVDGKKIPIVDILITTQNWAQFVETWDFQNIDKNVEPPFITVVRTPEVKYGTNPATVYNIPNRRQYYYMKVPTWDGQRHGMDIYKIPQPIPVDIKYTVAIVCNRMRELNEFNKVVLGEFASRQAYQVIKGHYIPIINDNISDESVTDLEKRKVYIQKYDFTLLGFLIDENEFEVSPAITRSFTIFETDTKTKKRRQKRQEPPIPETLVFNFKVGDLSVSDLFSYVLNLNFVQSTNVDKYEVYINDDYYGEDISEIQINNNDTVRFEIIKNDETKDASLEFKSELL
jgi:hypothetical protein